jgi:hypothetical protein
VSGGLIRNHHCFFWKLAENSPSTQNISPCTLLRGFRVSPNDCSPRVMRLDDLNVWVFGFKTSFEIFARPESSNQEDRLNIVSFQLLLVVSTTPTLIFSALACPSCNLFVRTPLTCSSTSLSMSIMRGSNMALTSFLQNISFKSRT